jgi:transposase
MPGSENSPRYFCQSSRENPLCGTVYVFRNRTGTTLKLLAYDGQGFWLCTKRLSQGRFHWWPTAATPSVTLSARELRERFEMVHYPSNNRSIR